jgi:hypothetical protein
MAFVPEAQADSVPEGQADSSQARSACVSDSESPRPGGTVEVIVSPEWH